MFDRLMLESIEFNTRSKRSAISIFYFFMHFILGFLTLWLIFTQFKEMQRKVQLGHEMHGWILDYEVVYSMLHRSEFGVNAAIETFYLVVCVLWGSLGWDRVKELRETGAAVGYQMWGSFSFSLFILALAVQVVWINSSVSGKMFSSILSFTLAALCFARYLYLLSPQFRLRYKVFWGMRSDTLARSLM